ncbi:hypothetical protein H0E84_15200 [Luteimonas sp. SJ-92]|uniref:ATP-binding protein n=1 Tax=Luteimonas salinisoli TaxID=2752307 RepID=A0A853JEH1_9GAMM|nr:hypothetical protein [Luteimonas salinisoli]NZA27726.1 hypothetical protein [Luteimonas salinisoli]
MPVNNSTFYAMCNLKDNPFRSNALFDDDPRLAIWAGQTKEQNQLQKFLIRSRAEQVGNTNLTLLYGAYGTGKSHALLWGIHWLRGITDPGKSAAYYVPTLKKDKGRLSFGGAFHDDLIQKTSLVDDALHYRTFLSRCVNQYTSEKSSGADVTADEVIQALIPSVEIYNFAKELYRYEKRDEMQTFLSPKGQTDYQAMITFTRLVNLFVHEMKFDTEAKRFRQSVHLMIDEIDALVQASTKEVLEVNDLIRHLYDLCPSCFGLVLAVSAEQEILPSIFTEYVLTRVSRQIEFKPFDRDAAVEFAIHVMDENRVDPTTQQSGAFPYTREALEAILGQLTFRTPRKVVNVMQQVIEESRLADLDPSNGPITVSQLDDSGVLEEVL